MMKLSKNEKVIIAINFLLTFLLVFFSFPVNITSEILLKITNASSDVEIIRALLGYILLFTMFFLLILINFIALLPLNWFFGKLTKTKNKILVFSCLIISPPASFMYLAEKLDFDIFLICAFSTLILLILRIKYVKKFSFKKVLLFKSCLELLLYFVYPLIIFGLTTGYMLLGIRVMFYAKKFFP